MSTPFGAIWYYLTGCASHVRGFRWRCEGEFEYQGVNPERHSFSISSQYWNIAITILNAILME